DTTEDVNGDNGGTVVEGEVPEGHVRIHYHRYSGDYDSNWGVWLWGDALVNPVENPDWDAGVFPKFTEEDEYGVYRDFEIGDASANFNIVVRNVGGAKDGEDRTGLSLNGNNEFWLIEGNNTLATEPFYTGVQVASMEIISDSQINIKLTADMEIDESDFHLKDNAGNEITGYNFAQDGKDVTLTGLNLAFSKNYKATVKTAAYTWATLSKDLANSFEFEYTGNDLGVTLNSDGSADLKLWTPVATEVKVHVYSKDDQTELVTSEAGIALTRKDKGIWSITLDEDNTGISNLDEYYYQYEVTANGETNRALDPYAKSMASYDPAGDDKVGKAAIIDTSSSKATPIGFDTTTINPDIMANNVDMVVSEIHVRDFTIAADIDDELKGTYKGFTEGINYLKDLGVTHVQLLPIHNFYTVNETDRSYVGENDDEINFNWGYDPHNYFTPEGWYSTDATDPYSRVKELKQLVQSLHEAGIGVIIDVVYNHTYNNDTFNNVAPGLYYRPDTGTGPVGDPAVATENTMVRKLVLDSMKYYVDEFGIDGFRFDLMGFIDKGTMDQARAELGDDIILHGEAWNFTDLNADAGESYVKGISDNNLDIGYFNDTSRDSYAAHVDNAGTKGFLLGQHSQNAKAKAGIIAGLKEFPQGPDSTGTSYSAIDTDDYNRFADSPEDTLNYQSIHDGFTLWDRVNLAFDGSVEERIARHNQALAMLMTSQGKVINQGGVELGRSKPFATNDGEPGRAHTTEFVNPERGTVRFHENSYSSSDFTNMIDWTRAFSTEFDNNANGENDILEYYRGLIKMRRNIPALRYASADNIKDGLRFIGEEKVELEEEGPAFAGYTEFSEVDSFTINFINADDAAKGNTYYFAGEPQESEDNPESNDISVTIDDNGEGSITFTSADISKFRLDAWGATSDLNFKLVETPGEWDALPNAYSGMGNTRIIPSKILEDDTITVDLSIIDHQPGSGSVSVKPEKFIAYTLDNTLERDQLANGLGGTAYTKLIVLHNAANYPLTINTDEIVNKSDWTVIMDGDEAGIDPLSDTEVEINDGAVTIPAHSSAVIAK
ncbi:MAG: alpha-amylase family glycosyl hydrolase, partial [Fusobacteriota bacterium]